MNPPLALQPRQRRYSVRRQARLDAETNAKLETLARDFHRKRAVILRSVMQWGLAHTNRWTIEQSIPDRPHLVHMPAKPERLHHVQAAADTHGASVAAWLRHAVRQVTREDFPESWRAGERGSRSHESGYYDRQFTLRLDAVTSQKLEALTSTFHRPAAEVIRELMLHARPENFPQSWHLAVNKR